MVQMAQCQDPEVIPQQVIGPSWTEVVGEGYLAVDVGVVHHKMKGSRGWIGWTDRKSVV